MSELLGCLLVEITQSIQARPPQTTVHAGRIGNVENGVSLGPALHALVNGGDEPGAEGVLAAIGLSSAGNQYDVTRKVLVFGTESVGRPCSKGGTAGLRKTGVHEQFGRGMIELVGVHRLDNAKVIGMLMEIRNGIRHPHSGFSILLEGPGGTHELGSARGKGKGPALHELVGACLVGSLDQFRFVIPHIKMGRRAGQVNVDDALGLGIEMRFAGQQGVLGGLQGEGLGRENVGQGAGPESHSAIPEEVTASLELNLFEKWIHCGDRFRKIIVSSKFRRGLAERSPPR